MALTQISTAGIKDDLVTAAKIADDAVTEALISDDSVDEARLKISNAGSNGQYLQKQSGNTGGLTWATVSAGGITDVVSDTSPQLGGDLDTNSFEISLDDDHKIKWGDGDDLRIWHDGTDSHVKNSTGPLYVQADSLFLASENSESYIQCAVNGSVILYYDNSQIFETFSWGARVHGNLSLVDNKHLYLGSGNDLDIYHDGSNSYIKDSGTGELKVLTDFFIIQNAAGNETQFSCDEDGQVNLYHNNALRFNTS